MECPNCGQENRDVARFCQHCGASLVIAEFELAEPVETPELGEAATQDEPVPGEQDPRQAQESEPRPDDSAPADTALEPGSDERTVAPEPVMALPEQDFEPVEAAQEQDAELTTAPEPPIAADLLFEPTETELPADAPEPAPPETGLFETANSYGLESENLEPQPEPEAVDEVQELALPDQPLVEVQELADAHMLPWSDEPAALQAHELGTILNGRYKVIEVLDVEPAQIQYRVRDLQRCPRCGTAGHSPDEAFCTACGALMDQKPVAFAVQQPASTDLAPEDIEPEDQFVEEEFEYWVWREDRPKETADAKQPLMRLLVGLQSDTGLMRELDEDSIFALTMAYTFESVTHQLGLFIVADGMGGHEGGEVASQMAIQTTAQTLLRDLFGPELAGSDLSSDEILGCIESAISHANDKVYLERQKREIDMGTTLTAAFIKDWSLHLGHVGDSRAYRWGTEGLQQLTTDHSIVAGMVAAGTILPEEIYTHPQRSVIYRCIGDQPTVEVDLGTLQLEPGQRLLVCCDGLWEMLRGEGIEDTLLAEADPQTACDLMVHQANLAGGTDNISVVIVQL
jgi:serine/threonine protein phosphatase PrpC